MEGVAHRGGEGSEVEVMASMGHGGVAWEGDVSGRGTKLLLDI